ncbi:aminotransferase class IV [Mycobacterium tuberculosis]
MIASPAGAYFKGGIAPVSVWVSTEYVRACPGGTGAAKFGGNFAASLLAQAEAAENGCDQVVWLDAVERRYIEEMGGMNIFFVARQRRIGGWSGAVRFPAARITRDSLLQLAIDAGFAVEERRIDIDEWRREPPPARSPGVCVGTAAVITPVARVRHGASGSESPTVSRVRVTMALRDTLTGIQRGTFADTHGWMARLG